MEKHPTYLTIDDGPSPDSACKIRILNSFGIQAIWFCRGEFIERFMDITRDIILAGNVIGNHSFSHPYFSRISVQTAREQVTRTEHLIELAYIEAGIPRPLRCFRFPWGDKGTGHALNAFSRASRARGDTRLGELQEFLAKTGFRQPCFDPVLYDWYIETGLDKDVDVYWTLDPEEWRLLSKNPKRRYTSMDDVTRNIENHFARKAKPSPEIVVVHDFEQTRGTFLPIVEALLEHGVEFRTIPSRIS